MLVLPSSGEGETVYPCGRQRERFKQKNEWFLLSRNHSLLFRPDFALVVDRQTRLLVAAASATDNSATAASTTVNSATGTDNSATTTGIATATEAAASATAVSAA